MKSKTAFTMALAALLFLMMFTALHVPPAKAQPTPVFPDLSPLPLVYVDPPTTTARQGQPFNVSVYVSSTVELDLYAFQMNMTWDPSILSYVSFTKGDEPAIMTQVRYTGSSGTGQLLYGGVCTIVSPYVPVTSPLKLFTVTFQGINGGTSSISLINVELLGISDHGNGWPPNTPVFNGIPEFTSYDVWPDIDQNGFINVLDVIQFANHFFSFLGSPYYSPSCDFNADSCVDTFDMAILQADFNKDSNSSTWPNSTYPLGLTNTIYGFNENVQDGSANVRSVDVAVTDITNMDGMVIYFCGTNRTSGTNVPINVTVARLDSNSIVPLVEVNLTLRRINSEIVTISNSTVLLAPGEESTVQFLWNETLHTLSAGNYDVYAFADIGPGDIYDTNMTNNIGIGGRVRVVVTKEDFNGDRTVDTLDAILLANAMRAHGPPGWIPQDLMPDGVVDWSDLLMLYRMLGWEITNSSFVPGWTAWNLTVSTPLGQTQNDTVVILSNYIVYSEYSFNTILKQLSFNITSSIDGFCNVSIPASSMSGAFTVYLDDVPTPSVITWNVGDLNSWNEYAPGSPDYLNVNAARCFIYFDSTGLSQKVRIVSEYVDKIPGDVDGNGWVNVLDAIDLSNSINLATGQTGFNPNADFDYNGVVNILDAITLSTHFDWRNP